jgi:hypothetical protein
VKKRIALSMLLVPALAVGAIAASCKREDGTSESYAESRTQTSFYTGAAVRAVQVVKVPGGSCVAVVALEPRSSSEGVAIAMARVECPSEGAMLVADAGAR